MVSYLSSNRLEQHCSSVKAGHLQSLGTLLSWLWRLPAIFLNPHSNFLRSPWHLWLQVFASYLPSLGLPAGIPNLPHTAWPPRPSFEVWVEASVICVTCILHAYRINLAQMTQKSANSLSSSQALLVHGYNSSLRMGKGLRRVNESQKNRLLLYCVWLS